MKNRIFRSNNKKGYTLAEVLIAIAIIAILGAVAAISANRMIKDSRQKSLDKMAETIFLVAERNIQKAYWVDGVSLGASGTVTDSSAVDIKNKVLPDDTVSADISSAKWFITYESKDDNCHVDYVYCTTSDNSYASTFAYDEGTLSSAWSSKEGKVGYYNGGDMDELPYTAGISSDKMYAALKVENKEELGVGVYIQLPDYEKNPDYYGSSSLNPKNVKYKLSITGLNSGAVYTFDEKELNPSLSKFTYQRRTKNCFISTDGESGGKCAIYRDYVVLDNLSDSTKQFKSIAKASESGLIPGEDILIEISATCVGSEAELSANANLAGGEAGNEAVFFEDDSNGWGKSAQTNSLFAKREVVDADSDQVEVAYGRHLQNLDTLVSGMPEDKKLKVVQTKTIDFNITDTTVPINENWIDLYGSDWTFTPIDNKKVDSYDGGAVINPSDGSVGADGQTQGVRNLIVNYTTRRARATDTAYETAKEKDRIISAGIFGKFYGSEIKNVLCHGFLIDYRRAERLVEESTAVGCLVGRVRTNLKLRNCRAENAELTAAQSFTTSQDKVMMGGLVGHALDGVDVQYCFTDRSIIIGYENCCYASGLIGFTSSANYTPDSPQMDNTEAVMKDCKVSRSIVGGVRSGGIITGGMIAYTYNKNLIFENCIVEGVKFSASSGNGVAVVGGIVGSPIATTGLIKNCKVYNTADDEAAYVESAIGNNGVYDKSNIAKARKFVNSTAVAGTTNYDARNNSWMYTVGGSSTSEDGKVDIVSMGGLAGLNIVSSGNALIIENSFASTTMYAQNNRGINGGLIGNGRSQAKAIIRNSYADCYLNGQFISGLASNCKDSEYYNSYSTGFLRCDGAIKAAGITTSKATVSGCYSLMNYDNIWDTNKFNTTNLTFSDGYVSSYPGEAKPVNNNASLKNYIYLIAGDNSTVDENTYYTYGGDGDWIKDQSAQTSNKSQYASLRELVDKLGEQTDIIPSRLAPACISDNLASTKLPLILATSGTFTDTHYGDWLERPGNRLYARVYKTSDNKYVMFFEKGGRKSTLPTNSAITLTTVGEWLADDGSVVATGTTPSVDSGFLKQSDVLPTDTDQSDATKLAKAKLIAPWQYDGTGNVSGWTASTVQSITSVTFDEDFCKDTKVTPAKSMAKPLSMRNWFKNFYAVTTFNNINNLDVSNVASMRMTFFNCYAMPSYDITGWNTRNESGVSMLLDTSYMFGCADGEPVIKDGNSGWRRAVASSITFGNGEGGKGLFDTSNVILMNGMFQRQNGITTIDLSKFVTSKVTDMSHMFNYCSNLTSITGLNDFDVREVTSFRQTFYSCTKYVKYDISKWVTTEKLVNTRSMFAGPDSRSTEEIIFGENFVTTNVVDMSWMFENQKVITSLDLRSFNTPNVTDFSKMFVGCSKLETIYASTDFVTTNSSSHDGMFEGCSVLVGGCGTKWADKSGTAKTDKTYAWIDGRITNSAAVNAGGEAYQGYFTNGGYSLWARIYKVNDNPDYELVFEKGNKQEGKTCFAEYPGNTFLVKRSGFDLLGGTDADWVAYAPWHGKWTNSGMDRNELRENITKASFTDEFCALAKPVTMRNWFANMYKLEKVDFNTLNTSKVVNMMGLFSSWPDTTTNQLTELDLRVFDTTSLEATTHMFRDCKKLVTIRVSKEFSLNNVANCSMFTNCDVLVGVYGTAWADKSGGAKTDKTYAWIDGRDNNPMTHTNEGYFTCDEYSLWARFYSTGSNKLTMYFELGTVEEHSGDGTFLEGAEWIGNGPNGFLNRNGQDGDSKQAAPWYKNSKGEWSYTDDKDSVVKVIFTEQYLKLAKPRALRNYFIGMTKLKEIQGISDLDVSRAEYMNGAFAECYSLEELDLRGWNTDTDYLKDVSVLFRNCTRLKTIYADTTLYIRPGVANGDMFSNCQVLVGGCGTAWKDKTTGQTNRTYAWIDGRIGNNAAVNAGGQNDEGYFTNEEYSKLCARIYQDGENYVLYFERGPQNYYIDHSGETFIDEWRGDIDNGFAVGTSVPWRSNTDNWSSSDISKIKKVIFHEKFCTTARPVSTSYWFDSFTSLKTFEGIDLLNTTKVTNMSYMFQACSSIVELDGSGFDTANVKDMSYMFQNCSNLTTIYAKDKFIAGSSTSTYLAYYNCKRLVGGEGTICGGPYAGNFNKYVKIDRAQSGDPGYFTDIDKTGSVLMEDTGSDHITMHVYFGNSTQYQSKKANLNDAGTLVKDIKRFNLGGYNYEDDFPWHEERGRINAVKFYDTDLYKISSLRYWFSNFTSMESFDSSQLDDHPLTNLEYVFLGCKKLNNLDLSGWDVSRVEKMTGMFNGCSSLTELNVLNWDTTRVTTLEDMFSNCTKLKVVDLSSFNVANVKSMKQMFFNDSSLTTIYATDNLNVSDTTSTYLSFYNCKRLVGGEGTHCHGGYVSSFAPYVRVDKAQTGEPGYFTDVSKTGSVLLEDIGSGEIAMYFYSGNSNDYNSKRDELVSAGKLIKDISRVNIGGYATAEDYPWHEYRAQIKTVNFLNREQYKITSLHYWFSGFSKMTHFDTNQLDGSLISNMSNAFANCSALTDIDLTGWDVSAMKTCDHMFSGCANLSSIDISTWNWSKCENMSYAFNGCRVLTNLNLSSVNTKNLTNVSFMFNDCKQITELDLTQFETQNVTSMEQMVCGCTNLVTIYATDAFICNCQTLRMFNGCSHLVGGEGTVCDSVGRYEYGYYSPFVRIDSKKNPGYFTAKGIYVNYYDDGTLKIETSEGGTEKAYLTKGSDGRYDIDNTIWSDVLTSITKFEFATSIDPGTSIAGWFSGATNLVSVEGIDYLYTETVTDMSRLFEGCTALTSIETDKLDVTNVTTLANMFEGCIGLTTLDLSGWDVSNATNMTEMFKGCSNLQTVTVSIFNISGVIESTDMFSGCLNIAGGYTANPTVYDSAHVDKIYARIDRGKDSLEPGYFTAANASGEPVSGYESQIIKITFANGKTVYYYDGTFYPTSEAAIAAYTAANS